MAHVGLAVGERRRARLDRRDDPGGGQGRGDRLQARPEALGDDDDIGGDALLLQREERARAPGAAHHLVGDQQHAVAVAYLSDAPEIARRGRRAAESRAGHRLGDESGDVFGADPEDFSLQRVGDPLAIGFQGLPARLAAIGVAGGDAADVDQHRRVGRAPRHMAADRKGAERRAVIGHFARDEPAALSVAALQVILARQFQRRLDRFRARAQKDRAASAETGRGAGDEVGGEALGGLTGEKRGMGIGELTRLRADRGDRRGMRVAEARHRRAAAGVDIVAPLGVEETHPRAAHRHRRRAFEVAMKNAAVGAHGRLAFPRVWPDVSTSPPLKSSPVALPRLPAPGTLPVSCCL